MSASNLWLVHLEVATAVDGSLAGARVDQSIKQLPPLWALALNGAG